MQNAGRASDRSLIKDIIEGGYDGVAGVIVTPVRSAR